MATVINNPSTSPTVERTTVERTEDGSAGWAVAIIILLAIVAVGGFLWLRAYRAAAPATTSPNETNINVTLPESQIPQNQAPQNSLPQSQPAPAE
jgi:hypothetical protein